MNPTFFYSSLASLAAEKRVSAPSESWCILQGASSCRVKISHPPVSSVAPMAEKETANNTGEAYTENHACRRGGRAPRYTPVSWLLRRYFLKNIFYIEPKEESCVFTATATCRIGWLARTFDSNRVNRGLSSIRKHMKKRARI